MAKAPTRSNPVAKISVGVFAAFTWLLVAGMTFPRAITGGVADYGFFTAIAERLRAGDTLYVEVWDNKDPFVFYFLAVARNVGPNGVIGAWLLELSWVVIASIALFVIATRIAIPATLAVLVAFVLSPIVILGMPYFMGSTHLPAVALLLAAVALVYSDRPLLAGIAIGVLVFFKLVMVPIAIATIAAGIWANRKKPATTPLVAGFLGTLATVSIILLIRGELFSFVDTQVHNTLYSQSPIVSAEYVGLAQKIAQHLVILVNPHIAGVILVTAIIGLISIPYLNANKQKWPEMVGLWWTTAAAFVFAGATIAVTGKWFHHAEIFAVSSTLALVLLTGWLRNQRSTSSLLTAVIAVVITYPLAATPPPAHFTSAFTEFGQRWTQATTIDPLTRVLKEREPSSVAFIGESVPQAAGLEQWTIACRHVAQRPFNPEVIFTETLECLPRADTIVLTRDFQPEPNFPAFDAFIDGVENLTARDYTCQQVETFRICTRNEGQ